MASNMLPTVRTRVCTFGTSSSSTSTCGRIGTTSGIRTSSIGSTLASSTLTSSSTSNLTSFDYTTNSFTIQRRFARYRPFVNPVRGPLRIARLGGPKDQEIFKKLNNSGITKLKKFVAGAQKAGFKGLPPIMVARAAADAPLNMPKKKAAAVNEGELIEMGDGGPLITRADVARFKKLMGQSPYQAMLFLDAFQMSKPATTSIDLSEAEDALASATRITPEPEFQPLDINLRLKLDVDLTRESVRGTVSLPHAAAVSARLLVFCKETEVEEMLAAGADFAGLANLMRRISGGWTGFERCIASPAVMKDIVKVARILGPRRLMPSPRSGTVVNDLKAAIKDFKSGGQLEYRAEGDSMVNVVIGNTQMTREKILENIKAFVAHLLATKPKSDGTARNLIADVEKAKKGAPVKKGAESYFVEITLQVAGGPPIPLDAAQCLPDSRGYFR